MVPIYKKYIKIRNQILQNKHENNGIRERKQKFIEFLFLTYFLILINQFDFKKHSFSFLKK